MNKPKNNIGRMRNSRINQASKLAYKIHKSIINLEGYTSHEIINEKEVFAFIRDNLSILAQCFHELNAYNNALKKSIKE